MYIGIDVGGTNLVAGLVDENGKILHKASCPVDKSMTAEELTRQLAKLSLQAAKEADCPLSEIQAAGVGLPGLVSNKTGMVIKTTNMPFYNPLPGDLPGGSEDPCLSGQRCRLRRGG